MEKLRIKSTQKGITLVALVVTIVVLLILAGITIQLIMSDGGIIARAQQTKEKQRIAEILEQLNIAEADNSIKQMMKVTIDSCIEEIHTKGIVVPEYTEKQDNSHYQIITEDGYVFTVTQEGIDIVFEYLGQKGNLPPVIRTKTVTTNSIEIEVVANGKTIKSCTYYIKEQGAENYDAGTKKNETTHIYTGLTNDTIYSVKVAVEMEGESEPVEITKLIAVGKIPEGAITADITWGSGTASAVLKTTETGYTIQYQINSREGTWKEYTTVVTGLHHGDVVYARLYDGTSGSSNPTTANVIDDVEPQSATIELSSTNTITGTAVTATITQVDNESGVAMKKSKWVYNTTSELIGTDETKYTGGVFSSNPQTITLNPNVGGMYYLHVLTVDIAGNIKESISSGVNVKTIELEDIKAGEYIEYQGGDYTGKWRVLYEVNNSEARNGRNIQIITAENIANAKIGGNDAYSLASFYNNNLISSLNNVALTYKNDDFAIDARAPGTIPYNKNLDPTNEYFTTNISFFQKYNGMYKVSDNNYITDLNQIHKIGGAQTNLASREIYASSSYVLIRIRAYYGDQYPSFNNLGFVYPNSNQNMFQEVMGYTTPIVCLKDNIKIIGGNGTKDNPWKMGL